MARIARRQCLEMFRSGRLGTRASAAAAGQATLPSPRDAIRARYFPNVVLRTHENRPVRFYDDLIRDKVVILNFMYARCDGVCPSITANLVKVQTLLGNRIGRASCRERVS